MTTFEMIIVVVLLLGIAAFAARESIGYFHAYRDLKRRKQ